jgi:hypothetical protein
MLEKRRSDTKCGIQSDCSNDVIDEYQTNLTTLRKPVFRARCQLGRKRGRNLWTQRRIFRRSWNLSASLLTDYKSALPSQKPVPVISSTRYCIQIQSPEQSTNRRSGLLPFTKVISITDVITHYPRRRSHGEYGNTGKNIVRTLATLLEEQDTRRYVRSQ